MIVVWKGFLNGFGKMVELLKEVNHNEISYLQALVNRYFGKVGMVGMNGVKV